VVFVDVLEAKACLESGDTEKIKSAVEFLSLKGDIECVEALKNVKTKIPIFETILLESIDAAINSITKKSFAASQPDAQAAQPKVEGASADSGSGRFEDATFKDSASNFSDQNTSAGKQNDFPQNEYLDRVKDIWEKGKTAAIRNATFIKLKSQLNTIKNDKIVQLKHLGEISYGCFRATPSGAAFIDESIKNIIEIEQKIEKKQAEEKEIEESRAEGGFWNVVKASVSRFAGYTKIKLDISILQSNLESKLSALGQLIYDRLSECESVLKQHTSVVEVLEVIRQLDRQREEKEAEIAEISQQQ